MRIRYEDGFRERARIRLYGDIAKTRTPGVEEARIEDIFKRKRRR